MTRSTAEIKQHMDSLSDKIKELEKLKSKAEKIEFKHSKDCCPDVCKTIDRSISNLNKDLIKAKDDKDKILRLVETASKIFKTEEIGKSTLEKQALRKAKRIEVLINEQIISLESLKQTLSAENVCECQ